MSLDRNALINRGKRFLGHHITGVIDITDDDIDSAIDSTTEIFSIYCPHIMLHGINPSTDRIGNTRNMFKIRNEHKIIKVVELLENTYTNGSDNCNPEFYGDIVTAQLATDLYTLNTPQPTIEFTPPNILTIFPAYTRTDSVNIYIKLAVVHPRSLVTIPLSLREEFKDILLGELGTLVLEHRSYFQSLETTSGSINLDLDRYQQAVDKKSEVIEKLDSKLLKYNKMPRIYIA